MLFYPLKTNASARNGTDRMVSRIQHNPAPMETFVTSIATEENNINLLMKELEITRKLLDEERIQHKETAEKLTSLKSDLHKSTNKVSLLSKKVNEYHSQLSNQEVVIDDLRALLNNGLSRNTITSDTWHNKYKDSARFLFHIGDLSYRYKFKIISLTYQYVKFC